MVFKPRAGGSKPYAAAVMLGLWPLHAVQAAGPAHPPLPTPCSSSGPCGVNAGNTPFVQAGQVAIPVVNGTTQTINQASASAILNWQNFNIANGYSVKFNQPGATSAVLNRIWSADPSVIAGKLSANGQLYLINQNGIVFDHGAQVDVGGLTASTLNLTDQLFQKGILSNNANSTSTTALPAVFTSADPQAGGILVESGANLATSGIGGRIVLLGSKVTNNGSISTPDGQTILGAGNTVYLAASTDPALRGLLIEVNGSNDPANSTVVNAGQITAARGNVTLAGVVVNQSGTITATTSVSANGSVYLVAGDVSASDSGFFNGNAPGFGALLPNNGGSLTLAAGSVTQVLPDPTDTSTISLGNLNQGQFQPSQVNLAGKNVELQGNASIRAPGGSVGITAAADPYSRVVQPSLSTPTSDGSSIYLDQGSSIDVSGLSAVPIPVTQNLVQVRLETNDLADDPLLRSGFLHGQTVMVNVSGCITAPATCSTLFDVTPYVNNIAIGINQVLTSAGKIRLDSSGDVVSRAGSTLNVSGGSVTYQAGMGGSATRLLGADGKVYDIATAPNSVPYVATTNSYSYVDPTWGADVTFFTPTAYAGFTRGTAAGSLTVLAPQVYLRGAMQAQTVAGLYQRNPSLLPAGGTFVLGDSSQVPQPTGQATDLRAPGVELADGTADTLGVDFVPGAPLSGNLADFTTLSPTQLSQGGFDTLGLYSNGTVILPVGEHLTLAGGGSLTAVARAVEIDGRIDGPGAGVSLTAVHNIQGTAVASNDVTLGNGAAIDVAGAWVNDSPQLGTAVPTAPLLINGGQVSLRAQDNVVLGVNSLIDVSGGGFVNSKNKLTPGNAGSIALLANQVGATTEDQSSGAVKFGSGATLRGASLAGGAAGSLKLQSGSITIGQNPAGTPGELLLPPEFFQGGGFGSYSLVGAHSVSIGSDDVPVSLHPLQQNLVFDQNQLLQPTGADLQSFTQVAVLDDLTRKPASLSVSVSNGVLNPAPGLGDVTLSRGSSIVTDPGGSVSLAASNFVGNLDVFGSIIAPAGKISLQVGPTSGTGGSPYNPDQVLLLGPQALLSATADARITDNAQGLRQGTVLDGGAISLLAYKGSVLTQQGSTIDVSGAQGTIDLVSPGSITPTTVTGDAGTIDIEAREGIVLQGDLRGSAASAAGAAGGSLSIGLGLLYDHADPNNSTGNYPGQDRVLTLSDQPTTGLPGDFLSGMAEISTATIEAGGFDYVTLKSTDVIALDGAVTLNTRSSLILDAPKLQGNAGASASLSSAYIGLGNFNNLSNVSPSGPSDVFLADGITPKDPLTAGNAVLVVIGDTIDVRGNSLLDGFASSTLESSGDLRLTSAQVPGTQAPFFTGSLSTLGDLNFQAAQVYPTTAVQFTVNTPGTVNFLPGTNSTATATPLSAGGDLIVNAHIINQRGVVRAPLGEITLNATDTPAATPGDSDVPGSVTLAPGSLTSVAANGALIPFGATQNGQQWTYDGIDLIWPPPEGSTTSTIAPPGKQVNLTGANVNISSNAKVDLSGGGDVYAYEFIAGPGGSKDVLDGSNYTYAVVPSLGIAPAPIDAQYAASASSQSQNQNQIGKTVYLTGVPGLAAGSYTLLPPRYALLPGAFAVKVVTNNSDILPGTAVTQADGSYLVAGRFGVSGTSVLDSRTSTVLLVPDAVVRTQSQYNDSYGDNFFSTIGAGSATLAPPLAADAGALQLAATSTLLLDGNIDFQTSSFLAGKDPSGKDIVQQGRGGVASIVAPSIVVVDTVGSAPNTPPGALELSATTLNQLGAASLILGASENRTAAGAQLNVDTTNSVEIQNTAANVLVAPEIILAAKQSVTVDANGDIEGKGTVTGTASTLLVSGDGALLRVSGGAQSTLVRSNRPANATGSLQIGANASVAADGSLILDAAASNSIDSTAKIRAPAVTLSSSLINVGDVPAPATPTDMQALDLTPQLLAGLTGLTDLTLHSYSSVDFYGATQLGGLDPGTGKPLLHSVNFDAGGLAGYGDGDKSINAAVISLVNTGAAAADFATPPDGSGKLTLNAAASGSTGAGMIVLGAGSKTLSGFSGVSLISTGDVQAQGTGGALTLNGAGDLEIQAARLSTANGADQQIENAGGAVQIDPVAAAGAVLAAAGIGGKLGISGSSVTQNGLIDLPAGIVSLHATGVNGDVTLGSGSMTLASGVVEPFADTYAAASAGQIALASDQGGVTIMDGATVDVSGASSSDGKVAGDAGSLMVSAPLGQFALAGTLKGGGASGQLQGNFTLDAMNSGNSVGDYDVLSAALGSGGFQGAISERLRSGDVTIGAGDTVKASSFVLSADQGSIEVKGTIDTSGGTAFSSDGGSVALWAGNNLTVAAGAQLLAGAGPGATGARPAQGGNVTLGTSGGNIAVASGSTLDLGGNVADADGTLTLRAPAAADNSVAINVAADAIHNSKLVVIEGVQSYQGTSLFDSTADPAGSGLDIGTGGAIFSAAGSFAANATAIESQVLGGAGALAVQVRPGVEVESTGDLVLNDSWDLSQWRFNGAPVDLTLRAAGNLIFNASLSDGFDGPTPAATLIGGNSASYRLAAGADLSAANPLSTAAFAAGGKVDGADISPASGNLVLAPAQLIRTGDGSIDIAAGADVLIGCPLGAACNSSSPGFNQPLAQQSVIYTAGVPAEDVADFPLPSLTSTSGPPSYPTGGGNLSISAGQDIVSAPSTQLVSDWLWRQGSVDANGGINRNTSWWIMFNRFQQGVGALGGGEVAVQAGGDIVNLSAVVPSNGRLPGNPGDMPDLGKLVVDGGGNLLVQAGGDISSGLFEADWGNARIGAGGSVNSGRKLSDTNPLNTNINNSATAPFIADVPIYPILVYGYNAGSFDVSARSDLTIDAAVNATTLPEAILNIRALSNVNNSYFYTLTPDATSLNLVSTSGAVLLNNDTAPLVTASVLTNLAPAPKSKPNYDAQYDASSLAIYPPVVNIASLAGDISLAGSVLTLYPSATGNLNLLAENNVLIGTGVTISENDPLLAPSISAPTSTIKSGPNTSGATSGELLAAPLPPLPLHQDDPQPVRVVAATGDINASGRISGSSGGTFVSPKPAEFIAGQDIVNLDFVGKNIDPTDVTLFDAGGNIRFATPTDPNTNALVGSSQGIQVGGPGYVEALAGGSLNLGDGNGIVSTGSLNDARLPGTGASLVVGAGLGADAGGLRTPAYPSFINTYLAPQSGVPSIYADQLIAYMKQQLKLGASDALSYADALTKFEALPVKLQLPLVAQVLYDELSATGLAHTQQGTSYDRGYNAINTLFPTQDAQGNALSYSGDINLFFSQLKTEQGGNIDLLAPGGSVVVGLPNPPAELTRIKSGALSAAANLGILALGTGAVQGFANNNFTVNQSRILTLEGGDIILWASNGDIDAGRGAKSASAAPAPVIQTDPNGNVFVNPQNAVAGSGIGQLVSTPGLKPGLVNLIAPKGDVNAGDAGIRVAGNLNIAAVAVIGADNISVGGTASGVPVSDAGALSGALSGASALGDAGKNAVNQLAQNLSDAAAQSQHLADSLLPSLVVVKLFCLGTECELQ